MKRSLDGENNTPSSLFVEKKYRICHFCYQNNCNFRYYCKTLQDSIQNVAGFCKETSQSIRRRKLQTFQAEKWTHPVLVKPYPPFLTARKRKTKIGKRADEKGKTLAFGTIVDRHMILISTKNNSCEIEDTISSKLIYIPGTCTTRRETARNASANNTINRPLAIGRL